MFQSAEAGVISFLAPAKINLYLHITGRLDNGYHTLDSLVGFVDIGDIISLKPANDFNFTVSGPFAKNFSTKELDSSPNSSNLAVRAVWLLANALKKTPDFEVHLTKNLPMGAGIGGGSSDAATVLWALIEHWQKSPEQDILEKIMLELGADVPVCLDCSPKYISGIGEKLTPTEQIPECPAVLIFPGKHCPTPQIFQRFNASFETLKSRPKSFQNTDDMRLFLSQQKNQLTSAAIELVPEIQNALNALSTSKHCLLSRMSGSGSTCFGLFNDMDNAHKAAKIISDENPDWWVKTTTLNRPERY